MRVRRALLVLVTAGSVGCHCGKDKRPHDHGAPAIVAPLRAAMDAPEGKNPCETAHNAYTALDEACVVAKMPAPWPVLPKRDEFLDICQRMPLQMQLCLAPKYHSQHHEKCEATTSEMRADPWGKIVMKMINADGDADKAKPAGATPASSAP